jgi:hypothetical protein
VGNPRNAHETSAYRTKGEIVTEHTPEILSSEWLTAEETLRALEIKERTLQEWAQKKRLRWKLHEAPGRRSARVYSAADVEKLSRERRRAKPQPKPKKLPPATSETLAPHNIAAQERPQYRLAITIRDKRGSTRVSLSVEREVMLKNKFLAPLAQMHEHSMPADA